MGVKGYKAFNKDLTCRDFQYEIGKEYKHEGNIELCSEGFHFCKRLMDIHGYYDLKDEDTYYWINQLCLSDQPIPFYNIKTTTKPHIYITPKVIIQHL